MTGPGYRRWYERATVLAGKGATGLLPVAMLALCGRMSGAAGLGRFAIAFSLAQSVAELSDFASQRHVSRLQLNAGEDNQPVRNRLEAFNGLRLLTFAGGAAVAAVGLAILVLPPYLAAGFAALASALWLFLNNTSVRERVRGGSVLSARRGALARSCRRRRDLARGLAGGTRARRLGGRCRTARGEGGRNRAHVARRRMAPRGFRVACIEE